MISRSILSGIFLILTKLWQTTINGLVSTLFYSEKIIIKSPDLFGASVLVGSFYFLFKQAYPFGIAHRASKD